jgi:hypothetical protein
LYAKLLLSTTGGEPLQRSYVLGMFHARYGGPLPEGELVQYLHHFDPDASNSSALPPSCADDECTQDDVCPDIQALIAAGDEPMCTCDSTKLRVLMYDALSVSRSSVADEANTASLSEREEALARKLGLGRDTAGRIASVCKRERLLTNKRRQLLMADWRLWELNPNL